jgi:tRNA A-37 threonylcarbamoyl transferase component Bud32
MPTSNSPPRGATGPRSGLLKLFDLAKGGMGTVELALRREGEFRRLHAVKRLHPHLLEDEDLRAMFLDEARIAGLLRHANVVSVLDVGEDEQGPFLVMDYVDGVTLSAILQHHAPLQQLLPVQLCARIGGEIARGLAAAHELTGHDGRRLDIVHRDVSPQNVLVGFDGQVRLADFGIARALGRSAKLTELGVIKGKIGYQAPEQLRFEEASAESDLFALGVVLYELLSGKRLYKSTSELPAPLRILQEPPPDIGDERFDVPPALTELLFELLAKRREDRPESARVVATRLDDCVLDLLRDEEPILLAEYMGRVFGDAQRAKAQAVAEAVARVEGEDAEASSTGSAAPPAEAPTIAQAPVPAMVAAPVTRGRGPARARIAATLVIVTASAGGALLWASAKRDAASPVASASAPENALESAPSATAAAPAPRLEATANPGDLDRLTPVATASAPRAKVTSVGAAPRASASSAGGARAPKGGIPMWGWK